MIRIFLEKRFYDFFLTSDHASGNLRCISTCNPGDNKTSQRETSTTQVI